MFTRYGGEYALAAGLVVFGTLGAFLFHGADAGAGTQEVLDLCALCNARVSPHRKAIAIEKLCAMDSAGSREALRDLADATDDRTALLAMGALVRGEVSGAQSKLEDVIEDSGRSDFARCAALGAWCQLRKSDGDDWGDVSSYVGSVSEGNDELQSMAAAQRTGLFGEE